MSNSGISISPYLLQPLRTLAEAQEEANTRVAKQRLARLRGSDGQPIEPVPSIEVRKQQQAHQAGLTIPAKEAKS